MLAGRVCDDEERPVVGATVQLAPTERTVTTSDDGGFAFDDVPAGRYALVARKDDHYAGPAMVYLDEARSEEPVVLRMQRGVTLVVHVTGDGVPLADAEVALRTALLGANLPLGTLCASSNADGVVTLRGLAPQIARAWVTAPDWAAHELMIHTGVDPGGVVEAFVRLERGARIEGRVLGPRGRAVPDAIVQLFSDDGTTYFACSDEHGAWSLRAVAGSYHVRARSQDYRLVDTMTLVSDGVTAQRDVVVQLGYGSLGAAVAAVLPERLQALINKPETGRIAGVVRDDSGTPVGGVEVRAHGPQREGTRVSHLTLTDARGYFVLDELPPGEYPIGAAWPDAPQGRRDAPEVRARTGDMHVELVLPPCGTVTARVVLDAAPQPYVAVVIDEMACHGGGTPRGLVTRDGRFTLDHVPSGTWALAAWAPGARVKNVDRLVVEHGATLDLGDLVLERGQHVTGHVRDRDGVPVAGARVWIQDISVRLGSAPQSWLEQRFRGGSETVTDDAGAYALDVDPERAFALPIPRPPVIQARHPRAGVSLLAQLPPDATTVDLVLLDTGTISGVIEVNRPRQSLAFACRPDEPDRERFAGIDARGRFRFEDVPAGVYTITLANDATSTTVTVTPGQTVVARLVVTSTIVELRVRIRGLQADQRLVIERVEGTPPTRLPRRMVNRSMRMGAIFEQSEYLEPGKYLVSADRKTWLPITVAPEPAIQQIEVQVSDGRLLRVERPGRRR